MIDSTEFGSIRIDGKTYYSDVIVYWDGEVKEIRVSVRHLFGLPEFELIREKKPEVLIIGKGQYGLLKTDEEVKDLCEKEGIEFFEFNSKEAIEKFNDFLREGKRVVAFIHVTC